MKVIVECMKCKNLVEVKPETFGKVAYFERTLTTHGFTISTPSIEVDLQQDVVTDADDVTATLKEIRIDCDSCGEHICLSF